MTTALVSLDENIISSLVINGDLSRLSPQQKVSFYNYRCQQAGLDPAAKPFDLLRLNGKEILYANATATQQLCATRKLSVEIVQREKVDDTYIVHARVIDPSGRKTDNMGAVPLAGLKGDALSNAMMKATTKAVRRTVLSHCGLGLMDETEAETIPGAKQVNIIEAPPDMTLEGAMLALTDHGRTEGFTDLLKMVAGRIPRQDVEMLKAQARELWTKIKESERVALIEGMTNE